MRLFSSHTTPEPNVDHMLEEHPVRAKAVHVKLNAGDMPIIRTSGSLEKWKKSHAKIAPTKSAKSGMELLKEQRAERESRCS